VNAGNDVGSPGACTSPGSTLALTGEGSTKPKTLFKNNEDYTVVEAAYTTDGVNFTNIGQVNGINNPSYLGNAGDLTPVGQTGSDLLRYVGSRGTIVANRDGTYTMFMSGGDCNDGDSDAFEQIFYSNSTDGLNWTTPVPLLKTDQTFSSSAEQEAALATGQNVPLDSTAYYEGRAYDPTVVDNGNGTLTLSFSGYRTAKPLPAATTPTNNGVTGASGTPIGTNTAFQYTPGATDPALYRSILTTTISETTPTGPTGATGATGGNGATGVTGATGAGGTPGGTGATGASGVGVPGATGPAGPTGPQGLPGAEGPAGPAGPRGPRGQSAGKIHCQITKHHGKLVVICHESASHSADVAAVKIQVIRGNRTLSSGFALVRNGVITGRLSSRKGLGRGRYRIVISWPFGGQSAAAASVR